MYREGFTNEAQNWVLLVTSKVDATLSLSHAHIYFCTCADMSTDSLQLWLIFSNTLQHTAAHCTRSNALQNIAAHCSILHTLQHTATHCSTLRHTAHAPTRCNTLQHTAAHCNTLQHTVARCTRSNALQHTAAHCDTLQQMHTRELTYLWQICSTCRLCVY